MLAAESVAFTLSPLAAESALRLSGVVAATLSVVSPLLLLKKSQLLSVALAMLIPMSATVRTRRDLRLLPLFEELLCDMM